MNKFFHSVYLDSDKCTGCITCLKRCPTQAIRVRDGKAHIINEFCIDCGECIRHCPHHAKHTKRDFIPVLKDYKYTVALPAPSLYSQFNNVKDTNIILTALVLAGFDDVFEVSAGAEIISELIPKVYQRASGTLPADQHCLPDQSNVTDPCPFSGIDSTFAATAATDGSSSYSLPGNEPQTKTGLLDPSDIGIIFLSPCPSKITFIHDPLDMRESNVDAVLSH
ncbi:MAG: 4Fe-4S binding protein [Eubacterium ramulus]